MKPAAATAATTAKPVSRAAALGTLTVEVAEAELVEAPVEAAPPVELEEGAGVVVAVMVESAAVFVDAAAPPKPVLQVGKSAGLRPAVACSMMSEQAVRTALISEVWS